MIILQHIFKSYQKDLVINDFNYRFEDHGFYLLFGPSGCGKTTLLNILAGILKPDSGDIQYAFDHSNLMDHMAYIMQDSYFVDYLTMRENLLITCENEEEMKERAKSFQIDDKLEHLPEQLSGGEKQRFSILQALLSKKKVIILDEPTAGLDKENKEVVFEMLRDLKEQVLIICVSHDACAKEYCDEVIDFTNPTKYLLPIQDKILKQDKEMNQPYIKKDLYQMIRLQKRKKEKYSLILFSVILMLGLLIVAFSFRPNDKLIDMLGDSYHYNYAVAYVPSQHVSDLKTEYKGVLDIVYPISYGIKYFEDESQDGNSAEVSVPDYAHSMTYETLPIQGFFYHNHIAAGQYVQKKDEIMLGNEYAKTLNPDVNQLIGTTVKIPMPNGIEEFRVAGVFSEFGKEERYYLQAAHDVDRLNHNIFFNNSYSNQYIYDNKNSTYEDIGMYAGKSKVVIYFDSFSNLMNFYETVEGSSGIVVVPISESFQVIMSNFNFISVILLPTSLVSVLFSALFYIFSRKQYVINSMKNICVYQYYGYTWEKIITNQVKYIFKEVVGCVGISLFGSLVIACCINECNKAFHIVPYYPFSIQLLPLLLIVIVVSIFIFSVVVLNFKMMKKNSWYDVLKERRDLI